SDLNEVLKKWKIAKPDIVFSFCADVGPNDKKLKDFLVETVRLTGAVITVEEPSGKDILKKVVKGIERGSDVIPPTIRVVSRANKNDLYDQLCEGKCEKLTEEWTTLSQCTHLVFIELTYERRRALSFLNKSISGVEEHKSGDEGPIPGVEEFMSGDEGPAPVVAFMDPSDHAYTKYHIFVNYSKKLGLYLKENPEQPKMKADRDLTSCLIRFILRTEPKVTIKTVFTIAADLKANKAIGEIMSFFRDSITDDHKAELTAVAFVKDNWHQAMTVLTGDRQETPGESRRKKEDMRNIFQILLPFLHKAKTKDQIEKYYSSKVVVISFAVSSRAVLYQNTMFTWASLYNIFRKPYWHIFGKLFLDEIEGAAECEAVRTLTNSTELCPSTMAKFVMPLMLGAYMLIVQVLLMNLLIAKFSYTFASVHEETDVYWRRVAFTSFDLQLFQERRTADAITNYNIHWIGYGYETAKRILGTDFYAGNIKLEHAREVMFHSSMLKNMIETTLQKPDAECQIRLIISSVALGIWADLENIKRIIHAGPPTSLETYIQEIGRARRTGSVAEAVIYFNNSDISDIFSDKRDSIR
ncbi:TRPM3-like protein, partial [Mya arenaria]